MHPPLGVALNTVERYARASRVEELLRPPRYGRCLIDDYRDLVRRRLGQQVPVTRILAEIRQHGYAGSHNLLVRYINQGRADPDRAIPSPRWLVSWLMSRPENLPDHRRRHAVDNPVKSVKEQAGGKYKYTGEDATVILGSDGQVITTWARNSNGWRHP